MASSLLLKRAPSMSLMPMSYSYARVRWSIASAETPLRASGQKGPLGRAGESWEKGATGKHRGNKRRGGAPPLHPLVVRSRGGQLCSRNCRYLAHRPNPNASQGSRNALKRRVCAAVDTFDARAELRRYCRDKTNFQLVC